MLPSDVVQQQTENVRLWAELISFIEINDNEISFNLAGVEAGGGVQGSEPLAPTGRPTRFAQIRAFLDG